jgi:hypothetical protein
VSATTFIFKGYVAYATDRTGYLCKACGEKVNKILTTKTKDLKMRSLRSSALFGGEIIPAVSGSANDTLNSLANFLDYVELPRSAEQVRNMQAILQNIILIEHQNNQDPVDDFDELEARGKARPM